MIAETIFRRAGLSSVRSMPPDRRNNTIKRVAERRLRTRFGDWQEVLYARVNRKAREERAIIALIFGEVRGKEKVLCRVHSSCLSAHVLNSAECDCREQMEIAQKQIANDGCGLVIILDQDGKGNGHRALMLAAKLAAEQSISQKDAYQQLGFKPDARDYAEAAEVLTELGVASIVLLTNNPDKENRLRNSGISVVDTRQVALDLEKYPLLRRYYDEKAEQGHNVGVSLYDYG